MALSIFPWPTTIRGGITICGATCFRPSARARSLQVMVTDAKGIHAIAGADARIKVPGTRHGLGTRIVDTGSRYCSQNVMPVHFGLPENGPVDVEVTAMTRSGGK